MDEKKRSVKEMTVIAAAGPVKTGEDENSILHIKTEIKTEPELLETFSDYFCPICSERFSMIDSFEEHVKEHNSRESDHPVSVMDTNKATYYSLNSTLPLYSLSALSGSNVLVDTTESKTFNNLKAVGDKPFKCTDCSYAAVKKCDLQRHARRHTGEKPFKCSECTYASSQKYRLQIHMRTHTGEKPFKCHECSYAAVCKTHLERHVRRHTGEKPFKCSDCEYTAAQKSQVRIHAKKHDIIKHDDAATPVSSMKSRLKKFILEKQSLGKAR